MLTLNIDSGLSAKAAQVASEHGLNLEQATANFYQRLIEDPQAALGEDYAYGDDFVITNPQTLQAIEDAERIAASGRPGYNSGAELMAALGI